MNLNRLAVLAGIPLTESRLYTNIKIQNNPDDKLNPFIVTKFDKISLKQLEYDVYFNIVSEVITNTTNTQRETATKLYKAAATNFKQKNQCLQILIKSIKTAPIQRNIDKRVLTDLSRLQIAYRWLEWELKNEK